jgi:hypothetical protein
MTTRTILLTGARGGQGTTTVAAALALYAAGHGSTELVTDVPSTAALIGIPMPVTDESVEVAPNLTLVTTATAFDQPSPQTVVIDAAHGYSTAAAPRADEHYVVLRGPCYVALASLLAPADARPDGIVLVAERKRSLTARDVTDVLDIPVIATIDVTPDVARTIDAGLLISRLHRLREFAPLRALATDPYAGRLRPSTAHPVKDSATHLRTHTELSLSQSDNDAEGARVVKRVALSAPRPYVDVMWRHSRRRTDAEYRPPRAGRGRVLRRRGRHLGGGLLHRQG